LFHFVTAVLSAIASANLYTKSQPLILFVFWLLGYTSIITFSLAISSIFTKSTLATLVGLIVTFAGYFLTLAVNFQTGTLGLIFLISLHPIGAIAFGMQEIGRLEDAQVGATSTTIGSTDSPSGYTFSTSLRCLFVATVLWGIVSWYLNRIVRSDFGQPLPWNFPFSLNYWCPGRFARTVSHEDDHTAESYDVPVEEVGDALHANIKEGKGIAIRGLRKKFGDKIAVDGLSLSMYPGQVTALLGHNGAGKVCISPYSVLL
jgi:ABC-type multidrug transport system fused ATPase/permease subunit